VGIDAGHDLTVEIEDEAQNPMRRWMLMPKIYRDSISLYKT
jgi:hypothetical protein